VEGDKPFCYELILIHRLGCPKNSSISAGRFFMLIPLICSVLLLFFLSRDDLRTRTIPLCPVLIFAALSLLLNLVLHFFPFASIRSTLMQVLPASAVLRLAAFLPHLLPGLSMADLFSGIVPGLLLLLLSRISRTSVGTGDGITVLALGLMLGLSLELTALVLGLFLSAVLCTILLLLRKVSRSSALPFLPFLFLSHAILLLMEVINCSAKL